MRVSTAAYWVFALILAAPLGHATSIEGRVTEQPAAATPDSTERRAAYTADDTAGAAGVPHGVSTKAAQSAAAPNESETRDANTKSSVNASWFRLYDAGRTLLRDRDGDGHHSEFQIRFDADVLSGSALVYAKLYLRRVGDTGAWRRYYTTQDFWIYGQSGTDDYFVTTILDAGYPSGRYDVLIDLYEAGYSGIVATLTAYDDASLADLPLEERGLDVPIELPGFAIGAVNTTLLVDDDRDGFYSRYRVAFDPDSSVGSTYVYAELWIRPRDGEWTREHRSANFLVDSSGSADTYGFTGDLIGGYRSAHYDVQIDLFESASGLLIASAGSERAALSRVPLEDQGRDRYVTSHGDHAHGGGGVSIYLLAGLLLLTGLRLRIGFGDSFQRFAGFARRALFR